MRQVEEVGLDDGTLFVLGVLQPLQRRDSLASDFSHPVLQSLKHPVVDLVVEFIVDAGLLSHILEQLVQQLANSQSSVSPLNFMVVKQPGKEAVEEQGQLLLSLLNLGNKLNSESDHVSLTIANK